MTLLSELKGILMTVDISVRDIFDIAFLSLIIYYAIKLIRETHAGGLFKGLALLVALYLLAIALRFKAITFILDKTFEVGLLAVIILFQPELRRTLERVGRSKFTLPILFGDNVESNMANAIDVVCTACEHFKSDNTGALIVFEREDRLDRETSTGIEFELDAEMNLPPSIKLLETIFYNGTPLHDGAVIIRNGYIAAASCTLPLPKNVDKVRELEDKNLGTRHKSAVGVTEETDAIVVVVSEETAVISVVENGDIQRNLSKDALKTYLRGKLIAKKSEGQDKDEKKTIKNIFGGARKV